MIRVVIITIAAVIVAIRIFHIVIAMRIRISKYLIIDNDDNHYYNCNGNPYLFAVRINVGNRIIEIEIKQIGIFFSNSDGQYGT